MRRRATVQGMLRRRAGRTPPKDPPAQPALPHRCGCYSGDWNHVLENQPKETCPRCGGWRPKYG